jgi:RNA polymerase sigma-70 factor (ECF subfamily)
MPENPDSENALRAVLNAIATRMGKLPDSELAAGLIGLGRNPDEIADSVREFLVSAVETGSAQPAVLEFEESCPPADPVEFEHLYRTLSPRIFAYIWRMVRDRGAAEDALQEVFIKVFRKLNTLRERDKVERWLFAIAHNQVMEEIKKSHREPMYGSDELGEMGSPANWHSPELKHDLEKAIATLPSQQRAVVILHDIHGLSYRDISTILKGEESTLRVHRTLARRRLREFLS